MLVGIDIDGIILDFERTMRSIAEIYDTLILNKNGVVNDEFNYLKRYDWTEEERKNFIDDYLVYATLNLTPFIPLAKEMLKIFDVEGIKYVFITARGSLKKDTIDAVKEVFRNNGIDTDKIYFGVTDKVSKCIELGVDYMIEDNPDTVDKLISNKINTIYFRDKDSRVIEGDYLKNVSNIGDIVRYLISINGKKNSSDVFKKLLKSNT